MASVDNNTLSLWACRVFISPRGAALVSVRVCVSLVVALHATCAGPDGALLLGDAGLAAELASLANSDPNAPPCARRSAVPLGSHGASPLVALWVRPLIVSLAAQLERWAATGRHPCADLPRIAGLEELVPAEDAPACEVPRAYELAACAHELLARLGAWGALGLLGLRRTRLSLARAPPPPSRLRASFCAPWAPARSALTVGARALSKHWHREPEAARFWGGQWRGSDAEKNALASAALERVLACAVWANCHRLPTSAARAHEDEGTNWGTASGEVFEVRVATGHGARWSADGATFRGFLEPQLWDIARWHGAAEGAPAAPPQLTR
ncbi:hypothetical protein KFE25_007366 [Diacronema lutheri]|uniref:Uncharacterized protein n=1 Tax=Diacronema lutheri TaxID=2081491 RepID=A0A8J6CII4_DIALT|nr:hypothetical protein KFE25_007366 [Diacronema lutheri]